MQRGLENQNLESKSDAQAEESPRQLAKWVLNLEDILACLPYQTQNTLPHLSDIFYFLATTPENHRPLLPGIYRVNQNIELRLECAVIVRRDQYKRIRIDLFNPYKAQAGSTKASLYEVTTVNCVDLAKKEFAVKPVSKYLVKEIKGDYSKDPALLNRFAATYDMKDDPTQIVSYMTNEANNMRAIGFNKVRGPYFKANTGLTPTLHGFFSMKRVDGMDLFDRIHLKHFATFEKKLELILRCLHAADKQVHQFGKLHLDIKPENIMAVDYATTPIRTRVQLIDCETLHDKEAKVAVNRCGTQVYAAPELANHKIIHPTADVYSLGILSRLIAGDKGVVYFLTDEVSDELLNELYAEIRQHGHIKVLYEVKFQVNPKLMQNFINWQVMATKGSPEDRIAMQTCVEEFEKLYIDFRLSRFPGKESEAKCAAIKTGLELGFQFAKLCRETGTKKLGLRISEVRAFLNKLMNIAVSLQQQQGDAAEFIWVIDDVILFNCKSHEEIRNQIEGISYDLVAALRTWNELVDEIRQLPKNNTLLKDYNIFFNTIKNTPLTLDKLCALIEHINKKHKQMQSRITALKESTREDTVEVVQVEIEDQDDNQRIANSPIQEPEHKKLKM